MDLGLRDMPVWILLAKGGDDVTTEIKPCPFCNRVAIAPGEGPSLVADCNDYRYVTCPCGADGPEEDSDDNAIAAWNAAPRLNLAEHAVLDAAVRWAAMNDAGDSRAALEWLLKAAERLYRERREGGRSDGQ